MRTKKKIMVRQTADEIDRQAADWIARVDRGLSPDEERALDDWLHADPRRVGAYGRMRATAVYTQRARALSPDYEAARFRAAPVHPALSRRGLLVVGGGALAAGIAGVAAMGMGWTARARVYATRLGEVKVTALSDGSLVTLNTASRVRVDFTSEQRTIWLLEGEAFFDVAKDAARPFLVRAGDTVVRAVGTSFTVRWLYPQPVQVLVREGIVDVTKSDAPKTPGVRVAANMRVVSGAGQTATPLAALAVEPREIGRALAWRQGRIAFQGETLLQAAREFARYSDTRIVIDDPVLAAEQVSGLYQANDPVGFARAIALALDLRAEIREGEVRLHR